MSGILPIQRTLFKKHNRHIKCTSKLTPWLPRWSPYCKMTDLHLEHFLYLLHSCTHYYQSRGLVTWPSFSAGAMEVLLQNCTVHTTSLHGGFYFFPNLEGLHPFIDYHSARGNHPDDGSIFPSRKPILFGDIIMHFLHSCIHCDLDHYCSTLHKSRDGFWHFFRLPDCTGHITKLHGGFEFGGFCQLFGYQTERATILMMAAYFPVENRSFSII